MTGQINVNKIAARTGTTITIDTGDALTVDTLKGTATAGSINVVGEGNSTTTNLQQGLCKHWITYDHGGNSAYAGVSGATLRDSLNCSTVTDVSTGIGEPNFTSIMSNNTYSPVLSSHWQGTTTDDHRRYSRFVGPSKFSTSAYAFGSQYVNGTSQDNYITSHVTGDLA